MICHFILAASLLSQEPLECSKELFLKFFPETFVEETLANHHVSPADREAIVKELSNADSDVIRAMEEKASKMTPDPLKDRENRQGAIKLFKEVLYGKFSSVVKKYGVNSDTEIKQMLNEIQKRKAERFADCARHEGGERFVPAQTVKETIKEESNLFDSSSEGGQSDPSWGDWNEESKGVEGSGW